MSEKPVKGPIDKAFKKWLERLMPGHEGEVFYAQTQEWTAKPFSPETRAEVERLIGSQG